ncbi:DsbA family protein [Bradyrhizobium sp. U87765 SZCCT0131]|uniref:DsbA family protein n=1 Tax=unclassified Bradyrhizobium TaxID=2631580 RepID=UPI001BAD6128|nr:MULTISPECIES: DsbA family protein [unclassified Bradyrhizobium]MBR1218160.1 DsbA family protein [Bradyrhizobium sp. U87765 SZCCT0131]MBR1260894.1 DsbA family protein [Bradyrhizobium sp. U87765 SZCCT0134]MBR1303658.1 DsbA family protein [Bradyrhizobium sp. U87765 SZCCT0110]MBR1319264.1 DsbA family protein [Bradyrhizobium sp. U87765 SZCCT0109]MBR1347589.1 DsbA family protein [Bradyrhizobium sp. U87765 SZCCT0048]
MILTRRTFSALLSMTGLVALAGLSPLRLIGSAFAQSQSAADVAKPSPLGDMALGPENASVTIVEYASMTCPHCAAFTAEVFPKIKAAYIDTGKVRFIFREFPLDLVAAAGSMMARCIAKDDAQKYFAVVDVLFKQQTDWVVKAPIEPLKRIGKQAGLSDEAFNACLKDQKILDGIKATQEHAADKLKVNSTPSFFVNGTLVKGETSFESFQKMIDPLLKA